MNRSVKLYYDEWAGWFTLLFEDQLRQPTAAGLDEEYDYLFHHIIALETGETVGFSNEGGDLARDYPRLMELLVEHPVSGRYDAPDLGLTDATLPEIITAIHERYVAGRESEFVYPVADARVPALQVADRPADKSTD